MQLNDSRRVAVSHTNSTQRQMGTIHVSNIFDTRVLHFCPYMKSMEGGDFIILFSLTGKEKATLRVASIFLSLFCERKATLKKYE